MKNYPSNDPEELNSYAWRMFEISEDSKQLNAAETWAKKALDLTNGKSWAIRDTYASLLFKNKKLNLAKAEALAAIESGKSAGEDVSSTEKLLAEIEESMASGKKPVKPAKK